VILDRETFARRLRHAVLADDLSPAEASRLYAMHREAEKRDDLLYNRLEIFKVRGIDLMSREYDAPPRMKRRSRGQ